MDTHYFAVLVGVGATASTPTWRRRPSRTDTPQGLFGDKPLGKVVLNVQEGDRGGVAEDPLEMGISAISSYRGGYNFEALGLSRALVADYFPGMTSRISGIGLAGLQRKAHRTARQGLERPPSPYCRSVASIASAQAGDTHALSGELIHALQTRLRHATPDAAFRRYSKRLREDRWCSCATCWTSSPQATKAVAVTTSQSVNEIRKRFVTPGMSLGALGRKRTARSTSQ